MRRTGQWLLLLAAVVSIHCHSSSELSQSEQQKLDPALQRLIAGEPLPIDRYATSSRGDTTVYSVLITTNDVEQLRAADLPVGSVTGDVVTARLTVDEIRRATSLSSVRSIENPSRAQPQSKEN